MFLVSLEYPFLIALSLFSNVYIAIRIDERTEHYVCYNISYYKIITPDTHKYSF